MSMIAKSTGSANIEKLESGVYTAVSYALIDLGLQKNEKFDKTQRKFRLIWNILDEYVEVNGEKLARTMSKEYSFSLHEKSSLRKDLQAWRNKEFTEDELNGFNLLNILNKACQLQIIKEEKNGNTYNNIVAIMALPKGTQITGLNETYYFDIENKETWTNWKKIPQWIRDTIKKAENYEESGLKVYIDAFETEQDKQAENDEFFIAEDDLPF